MGGGGGGGKAGIKGGKGTKGGRNAPARKKQPAVPKGGKVWKTSSLSGRAKSQWAWRRPGSWGISGYASTRAGAIRAMRKAGPYKPDIRTQIRVPIGHQPRKTTHGVGRKPLPNIMGGYD